MTDVMDIQAGEAAERRLPDLISGVIRLAADDLESCMADSETYDIDWNVWHRGAGDGRRCRVSVAGAVMARTMSLSPEVDAAPESFPAHARVRLERLERLRQGAWRDVLVRMDGKRWDELVDSGDLPQLEVDIMGAMRGRTDIRTPEDLRQVAKVIAKRGF